MKYQKFKQTEIGKIPEDWEESKVRIKCKIRNGKTNTQDAVKGGAYPLFDRSTKIKRSNKFLFDCEAVIIPGEGKSFIPRYYFGKFDLHQRAYAIWNENKLVKIKYLYYWITTHVKYLENIAVGSTVKSLRLNHLETFPIALPPLPEQRLIASILSSLDDKIELNNKMNKTLEAIGQAIFKKRFIDERKGDWEIKSLSEIANYLNGLALQKYPPKNENDLPVIKIRELKNGITENTDRANSDLPQDYIIEDGDILFSWSGSLEVVIWANGKGVLNQHLFKVTSEKYPKWFYYYWTLNHLQEFKMIAEGKATTMGHIKRHHLDDAKCLVPDEKKLEEMSKVMIPLIEMQIKNMVETRKLSKIRDALLPKLMSGNVRVK